MCINPIIIKTTPKPKITKLKTHIDPALRYRVPCGKCIECTHKKRMDWLFRVEQENKFNLLPNRWFITLTYNEKKVPRKKGIRTLYKRHPQLFFKRLRKSQVDIKYILVGEYGSDTQRPHYHLICWTNATVQQIEKAWNYGNVHFRLLAKETVLYTLKYILNPRTGDNEHKQKEYAVFSKGLGLGYLTPQMYDYHTRDFENPRFNAKITGEDVPLPRYYTQKIFTKYQHKIESAKKQREQDKKRHDHYRELKKRGFEGNKDAELKKIKLRKAKRKIDRHKKSKYTL